MNLIVYLKNHLLFICLLIQQFSFSQNIEDTIIIKKNELGLNLVPAILFINSTEGTDNALMHIFYKRKFKKNWHGRVSFSLIGNLNANHTYNQNLVTTLPNKKLAVEYSVDQKLARKFIVVLKGDGEI